jgi:hypothetical protein
MVWYLEMFVFYVYLTISFETFFVVSDESNRHAATIPPAHPLWILFYSFTIGAVVGVVLYIVSGWCFLKGLAKGKSEHQ